MDGRTYNSYLHPLSIAPIFLTSFVTGENIDLLSTFFNVLPKSSSSTSVDQEAEDEETEFQIDDIYTVPHVGTVLGGLMQSGKINIKTFAGRQQTYFLGPDHGRFMPVQIKSIQRQRCSVYVASAGQAVTIALRPVKSAGEGGAGDTSHCSTDDMLLASGEQPIGTRSVTATVTDQQGVSISTTANNTCDQFSDTASVTSTTSYTSSCLLTASGSSSKRTFGDLGGPFLNGGLPPFCFRKGQVLLSAPPSTFPFKFGVWEIDADLRSLTHDVSLSPLMHGVVYCGSVRQSARIVSIQAVVGGDCSGAGKSSSPNSSSSSPTDMMASTASNSLCGSLVASNLHFARVRLKFQTEREWIKVGSTLLFRTEKMKCVGKVVALVS